jgi:hypothetical protein
VSLDHGISTGEWLIFNLFVEKVPMSFIITSHSFKVRSRFSGAPIVVTGHRINKITSLKYMITSPPPRLRAGVGWSWVTLLVGLGLSDILIFDQRIKAMIKLLGKFCGILGSVVRFLCLLWIGSKFFETNQVKS